MKQSISGCCLATFLGSKRLHAKIAGATGRPYFDLNLREKTLLRINSLTHVFPSVLRRTSQLIFRIFLTHRRFAERAVVVEFPFRKLRSLLLPANAVRSSASSYAYSYSFRQSVGGWLGEFTMSSRMWTARRRPAEPKEKMHLLQGSFHGRPAVLCSFRAYRIGRHCSSACRWASKRLLLSVRIESGGNRRADRLENPFSSSERANLVSHSQSVSHRFSVVQKQRICGLAASSVGRRFEDGDGLVGSVLLNQFVGSARGVWT